MELTPLQISEIISNYTSSSEGFVTLQSLIMNSLMFHERELFVSENKDEQCNGFRSRRWYSHGFEFSLRIPRSRSGNFYPVLLGLIRNESEERARLFNLLYAKGLTTEQIGEVSECVYGRSYSKQQVSYLANSCRDDVEKWLCRNLSSHYLAVYIDATFISTHRDRQVSKEVQRCIYTTNWIERLNRKYKRTIYMRTSMPSAQAVIFLLGSVAMEETKNAYKKKIYQFKSWKNINENGKDKREK